MKYNILAIISNNTNNACKYNICLNNISIVKQFVSSIIIIDSQNEDYANLLKKDLENIEFINNFLFINDQSTITKWSFALENINDKSYDYILLLNDSIILHNEIAEYFQYIDYNLQADIELFSYYKDPNLFIIKPSIIDKFIFLNNNILKITTKSDIFIKKDLV